MEAHDCCTDVRRPQSQRALRLQIITIVWLSLECGLALISAKRAHSSALLAFGSDSVVELFSAAVVLAQFLRVTRVTEAFATRVSSVLLYVLAGVVVVISALSIFGKLRAESSFIGLSVAAAALAIMPLLAHLKRREARRINNRALAADAIQSATCAYLALLTLFGVAVNAFFHLPWVDSMCALLAVPLLIKEAHNAWQGVPCC